jgi:ubiquinone/menaquinone biosynthesis C-methylase UbiE
MSVREEFDAWAASGRDREMEGRHWHTAKHVLARMPIEAGDVVVDLGTGSGYAARALVGAGGADRAYGLDASPEMARNARSYTATGGDDTGDVGFLVGDFGHLPFDDDALDHTFTMEAFYYAADPRAALREVHRVLRPGGTFFCAVNFYEENHHSHGWPERVGVEMTRWDREEYRDAFRAAGFHVAEQDQVPDLETEIPPAEAFPTDGFETREAMVERYRELGTLLTVGVVP